MTHDEAIKTLRALRDVTGGLCREAVETALKVMERDRWISVEDSYPEPGSVVLCHFKNGKFAVSFWGNWKWQDIYDFSEYLAVTHWMPLPEPPKEET